jgi:succinate-semialdehyde dehydrogenase/glutarate-semialdehyde dehydrogenase
VNDVVTESRVIEIPTDKLINRNPATGEVIGEYKIASPDEVRAAVAHARVAQAAWAQVPLRKRVAVIRRFMALLTEKKESVAATINAEAGKPRVEALLTEVMVVLDWARFCAQNAYRVMREESLSHGNLVMKTKRGMLVSEPVGVVGIIAPWNYPFSIPATETLAALVTGNAVVIKPSELTPNSALKLAELLHEAGVPEAAVQVVIGYGPTGSALISGGIDKVVFTGSVATGKRVAAAAAEQLIPCLLELGGKDAMLVLEDADVDVAASAAVWGAMVNAGQTCISVERCYVHDSIYTPFVEACADKITKLTIGNGADDDVCVGPMISTRQLEIVESQVEDARSRGAHVVVGGKRLPALGEHYYAPTLITGIDRSMRLMQEETFGPVLPVIPFDKDEEAIAMANDSEFGLAASVWSGDSGHGERIARRISAGAVMVNDVISQFGISEAPHGGVKKSGIGRAHGLMGLREMVVQKYIAVERLPRVKRLWWYSYGKQFEHQMLAFVDMMFAKGTSRLTGALKSTPALWRKRL